MHAKKRVSLPISVEACREHDISVLKPPLLEVSAARNLHTQIPGPLPDISMLYPRDTGAAEGGAHDLVGVPEQLKFA